MDEQKRPFVITLLSLLLALTGALTALFWILFFSGRMEATETEQDEAYEHAFPVADTWMIACCMTAARNLLKMNRKGFFSGAAAASALIFLGCLDCLYYIENKKYSPMTAERAQMWVIPIWTISLGWMTLSKLWKNRELFARD